MTGRRFLLFCAACALLACGAPRRRWTPTDTTSTTGGGGTTLSAGGVVASGTPREQLEQLDGVLRAQSFTTIGPAVHGELPTNGLIAYAVDALPNACYTLAIIGEDSSQNIDLIVLDPYGRTATHNVRPDNHPWVSFCASQAGRFIARAQMAGGSGGYYYVAYQGAARMDLATFYGETPEATVATATLDAATQARLAALDQRLAPTGFSRVGEPTGLMLESSEPRNFQLNLQQGSCYAFATLGGSGAVDTSVVLNDASGQRLQADTDRATDALIEYCAPVSGPYALEVRMAEGLGPLFTVGYVRGAQAPSSAATEPVMASTSTAGAGLQENFALLNADMRARGYESLGSETPGQLAQGGVRDVTVSLESGRCYALLAVGDTSVTELDLALADPSGRLVDRDLAEGARPTVRICASASGSYTAQLRMMAGQGSYVFAAYRFTRGSQGPFGMSGLAFVRMSEVTALLHVEGYEPDPGFTPGSGRLAREGATATENVDLTGGQCYAVVVVGGDGINDLDVALSQGGTQLTSDAGSRNAFPSVRHCVTQDARFTLQINAAAGAGPYHYQVFSRAND
ncbi:MAG: hypothetical protein AB7S26_18455 [Sandaracinaceae bacterium]